MKFVVAEVEGRIDRLERLEIDVDLSLLALGGQNFTTVHNQAIRGDLVVKLQPLLGGGNGRQNGLTIDSRFDVRCGTLEIYELRVTR